jgi:hypothetical protein
MTLTILGALTGPLMTVPNSDQLARARAGERMTVAGAHTVGGVDGGPGIPVTGWSRDHGDVRVPHFLGLHAIQVLALVALAIRRVHLVFAAAASYTALFVLLLFEALHGRSLVDSAAPLAIWAVASGAVYAWIARSSPGPRTLEAAAL